MANEIRHSTLETNGGQVASVLSALIVDQLYDPTDLRALMTFVPYDIVGSDTIDVTKDANPAAFAAATSEIAGGQANTAYTTSRYQLAIARYVLQYQITDLLGLAGGPVDLERVVAKINTGVGLTMTDLLAALFPSLSGSVGTSGVNLTVDNIFDADFSLNTNNAPGGRAAVLHPVQINDLITSLRGEPGAMQWQDATAEMLESKGPGFKGRWNGIDFWQSDSVNTANAGADRAGALFAPGCWAYTLGPTSRLIQAMHLDPDDILLDAGGLVLIERSRDSTNGMTAAIGNFYPAAVEAEDARGIKIVTDA